MEGISILLGKLGVDNSPLVEHTYLTGRKRRRCMMQRHGHSMRDYDV